MFFTLIPENESGDYVTVEHRKFGLCQDKIQIIGMIEIIEYRS